MSCIAFQDKIMCPFIQTRVEVQKERENVAKPKVVIDYNGTIGGVV